jgi:hypothetical protein
VKANRGGGHQCGTINISFGVLSEIAHKLGKTLEIKFV